MVWRGCGTRRRSARAARPAVAAGAGIDQRLRLFRAQAVLGVGDVLARTAAGIDVLAEIVDGGLVDDAALALPRRVAVPQHAGPLQRAEDVAVGAGHVAVAVDVLDAHLPGAVM